MTNLQRVRRNKGLTQQELARNSGVSVKMIQKYEQGIRSINKAATVTTVKLALALGCGITELLEIEGK